VTSTLPGARLFHEGQFEGRTIRLPVFLGRRPEEPPNPDLLSFYRKLLKAVNKPVFRGGDWRLCERTGWADNSSFKNLVAWTWAKDSEEYLIAVNLSDRALQARISLERPLVGSDNWLFTDELSGDRYEREGQELAQHGLYVELQPWGCHFLRCVQSEGQRELAARRAQT
jgi:hypothetical protein